MEEIERIKSHKDLYNKIIKFLIISKKFYIYLNLEDPSDVGNLANY